jgi:hypothetical protein
MTKPNTSTAENVEAIWVNKSSKTGFQVMGCGQHFHGENMRLYVSMDVLNAAIARAEQAEADADSWKNRAIHQNEVANAALERTEQADKRNIVSVLRAYEKGLQDALAVIASLGYGRTEDVDEGHEEAFRAVEKHITDWRAALSREEPMQCAECDCDNPPEGCNWIINVKEPKLWT